MSPTQIAVIAELRSSGGFVSGEDLGRKLGVTRAAVAKAVAELRARGYEIDSLAHRGHRLVSRPDILLPSEILPGLETRELGRTVHHFDSVPSTQPLARTLAEQGAPHGTLVIAEQQESGRGRLGRDYFCPRGGIWCTLILRPAIPPPLAPLFSLAAGVAVAASIRRVSSLDPHLKWPNDVLINDRKVAGILTELSGEEQSVHYVLVGAGVNANFAEERLPVELQETATTLASAWGQPVDRAKLLQAYLGSLEGLSDLIIRGDGQQVLERWLSIPNTVGSYVSAKTWHGTIDGLAVGLDQSGGLIIEQANGQRSVVTSAEVAHVRGPSA